MIERNDDRCTSALTFGEVPVKPVELGDEVLARRYEAALRQGAAIIPFDVEAARLYAGIRKDRTIRPPDAIRWPARRRRAWIYSLRMTSA